MEADLHQWYGIDLDDAIDVGKSWHWFRLRVEQLLTIPPHLITPKGGVVRATRLGHALYPPKNREK